MRHGVSTNCLRFWPCLLHHLTHCDVRTRRALFAPCLQSFAGFFKIQEHGGVLERRAPSRNDGSNPVPHDPDFAVTLKKELVIDQSAVHDTCRSEEHTSELQSLA